MTIYNNNDNKQEALIMSLTHQVAVGEPTREEAREILDLDYQSQGYSNEDVWLCYHAAKILVNDFHNS